jgi:hypothetical protein
VRLTVEKLSPKEIQARLSGKSSAGHQFGGAVTFDRPRKALTRFAMVEFHEAGHVDKDIESGTKDTGNRSGLGVSFELATGDTAFDRLYPIVFTLGWGGTIEENNLRKKAEYLGQR